MSRSFIAGQAAGQRQVGQHRDREPLGHDLEADAGVVRPVAHVGLEAAELAAGAARHLVPAEAGVAGGPRVPRQLRQRHGLGVPARGRDGGRAGRAGRGRSCSSWRSTPSGRLRGWCCHSSPSTRSMSPSASAGSASSGSSSSSSQRRRGRVAAQRLHRGQREPQRHRLEPRDAGAPGDRPGGRGQVGLRDAPRAPAAPPRGRPAPAPASVRRTPAPGALEQPHARLALEDRELLGDGRRRELERVGHRGDGAALAAARAAAAVAGARAFIRNATEFYAEIGIDTEASCAA